MSLLPGTVIHGTMRPEDLIPAFIECLPEDEGRALAEQDWAETQAIADPEERGESMYSLLEELFTRLDSLSPEGHYFGAHPGDGADYGFWPCEDDSEEGSY